MSGDFLTDFMTAETIDVRSGTKYPDSYLSNFASYIFEVDGILCNSMEGFLQSLKYKDKEEQRHICRLVGNTARGRGHGKRWYVDQTLYWKGYPYKRDSEEYQNLINKAFNSLYKNDEFRKTLEDTGNANLIHSLGHNNIRATVLTERELCIRLMKLRDEGEL